MTILEEPRTYEVRHSTPSLGAEFVGLHLPTVVATGDETTKNVLRQAFLDRKVLVFRDQHLTPDEQVDAIAIFAEVFDHPTAVRHHDNRLVYPYNAQVHGKASRWHRGGLWRDPIFKIESLVYETVPETGGDTIWADQQAAYDELSPAFQRLLEGLTARFDADPVHYAQGADRSGGVQSLTEHPLVWFDEARQRTGLFFNGGYASVPINGLTEAESELVNEYLRAHASQPKFSVRYSWHAGDFVLWDNQATWHIAVDDYGSGERTYRKVIGVDPLVAVGS